MNGRMRARISDAKNSLNISLLLITSQFLMGVAAGLLAFFQGLLHAGELARYAWYVVLPLYAVVLSARAATKIVAVAALLAGPAAFVTGFALTYTYPGIFNPGLRQGLIASVVSVAVFLLARRFALRLATIPASVGRAVSWVVPALCLCLVLGLVVFPFRSDLDEFNRQRFRDFGTGFIVIADDRVFVEGGDGTWKGPITPRTGCTSYPPTVWSRSFSVFVTRRWVPRILTLPSVRFIP